MNPLCDPLPTRPIHTGWEFTMEPYPSGQFGFIDDPDRQFGNGSVWTRTWTRSDGLEPLLTLVTATSNILNYTLLHSKSPIALTICLRPSLGSHTMSMNGPPQKTTNMARPGGLFGSQQRPDDNVEASYNNAGNTPSKDTQFRQLTNQIHPPPGIVTHLCSHHFQVLSRFTTLPHST
jgi:hypothetical protein